MIRAAAVLALLTACAGSAPVEPAPPPTAAPAPPPDAAPAMDADEPDEPAGATHVTVRKSLGLDKAVTRRELSRHGDACFEDARARGVAVEGTLTLIFILHGDRKGPKHLTISGEDTMPEVAACLRQRMAEARWPTGMLDGVGQFEVVLEFRRPD